jgi:hypothetical protein
MCKICSGEYKGEYTLECCPKVTTIPDITGTRQLFCCSCPLLTSIPVIPGLKQLYCCRCPLLTSIPVIPGLRELECWYCFRLPSIPAIPGLEILRCYHCDLLTTIHVIHGLKILNCYDCPRLTSIPNIPGLRKLFCRKCWVPENPYYEKDMKALLTLQRFCRKNLRYWRIKNWVGTVACTEWFYHPQNMGGHKQIQKMGKFLSHLVTPDPRPGGVESEMKNIN